MRDVLGGPERRVRLLERKTVKSGRRQPVAFTWKL